MGQTELDIFRRCWNQHRIRAQRYTLVPAGIPQQLHFSSSDDAKVPVTIDIINDIRRRLPERNLSRTGNWATDTNLYNTCIFNHVDPNPSSIDEATELYTSLRSLLLPANAD